MAMQVKELIKKLKKKDENAMVEFVVVNVNGNLVCMDIQSNGVDLQKLLAMFGNT